jgi:predicted DNA-binding transcriptional regulator YafY
LQLASLLQAEPGVTGGAIAKRLKITIRTLRRDMQLLRDLGYPVKARTGKGGGYAFDPDETVPSLDANSIAAAVSQLNAARHSLVGLPEDLGAARRPPYRRTSPMPRHHQIVSQQCTSGADTDGGDHGVPGPRTA